MATPILDQFYDQIAFGGGLAGAGISAGQRVGQSFTVGRSGQLSQIDVQIWNSSSSHPVKFSLFGLNDVGAPLSTPLLTTLISGIEIDNADSRPYHSIDLSSFDLLVEAGQGFAFFFSTFDFGWYGVGGGGHHK